jgi:hypothetical protein
MKFSNFSSFSAIRILIFRLWMLASLFTSFAQVFLRIQNPEHFVRSEQLKYGVSQFLIPAQALRLSSSLRNPQLTALG